VPVFFKKSFVCEVWYYKRLELLLPFKIVRKYVAKNFFKDNVAIYIIKNPKMLLLKAENTKAPGQSRWDKMQPAKLASGITMDRVKEESPPSNGSSQKGACPSRFKLFEAAFPSSNGKFLR
jgi:hypothetical protein